LGGVPQNPARFLSGNAQTPNFAQARPQR
jgi:hypothetical protein